MSSMSEVPPKGEKTSGILLLYYSKLRHLVCNKNKSTLYGSLLISVNEAIAQCNVILHVIVSFATHVITSSVK